MHNPARYGTRNIETVFYGEIPVSGPEESTPNIAGLSMQHMGVGQYMMSQQPSMQPLSINQGGNSHLWAAGLVTGAIVLLLTMGVIFKGVVQF